MVDTSATGVLTQADIAELWCLWMEMLSEYDLHVRRCGICLDEGTGCCPYVQDGLTVYTDYHLRLLRFRRAQFLRQLETLGNDSTTS